MYILLSVCNLILTLIYNRLKNGISKQMKNQIGGVEVGRKLYLQQVEGNSRVNDELSNEHVKRILMLIRQMKKMDFQSLLNKQIITPL